jgi:hypothetical protein
MAHLILWLFFFTSILRKLPLFLTVPFSHLQHRQCAYKQISVYRDTSQVASDSDASLIQLKKYMKCIHGPLAQMNRRVPHTLPKTQVDTTQASRCCVQLHKHTHRDDVMECNGQL